MIDLVKQGIKKLTFHPWHYEENVATENSKNILNSVACSEKESFNEQNNILENNLSKKLKGEENSGSKTQVPRDAPLLKITLLDSVHGNPGNGGSGDTQAETPTEKDVQDAKNGGDVLTSKDLVAWSSSESLPLTDTEIGNRQNDESNGVLRDSCVTINKYTLYRPKKHRRSSNVEETFSTLIVDIGKGKPKVKQASRLKKGRNIYKMQSKKRGYCIIINNYKFNCPKKYRHGSIIDEKRLASVFKQLNFEVRQVRNLRRKQMVHFLKKVSKDRKLKKHDALVVIILSHGIEAGIMSKDWKPVPLESMIPPLTNENCPNLRNKPKMFFVQACRGDVPNSGIDVDVAFKSALDDCFVCYATQKGHLAMRNKKRGSWFGEALAEVLTKCAWALSFKELVQELRDVVGRRRSARGHRQSIDVYHDGLTKDLYFNPGFPKDGDL